jgi:hypothetical protein
MVLPDTSRLQAAVKVNEALSGQIEPGQTATIVSDALPDVVLEGIVRSVGVLAESGGWRDPNRRDYTVRIELTDGNDLGLKPSMRCKADIYVGRVDDALYVPVQSVFRNGPLAFVYVPQGSGYAQQRVQIGRASELYVEVMEGLEEGSSVLLRQPAPERIASTIDVDSEDEAGQNGRGWEDREPDAGEEREANRGEESGRPDGPAGQPERPSGRRGRAAGMGGWAVRIPATSCRVNGNRTIRSNKKKRSLAA